MTDTDKEYHTYLRLERGLSANSVEAYERDLKCLTDYLSAHGIDSVNATFDDLQAFVFDTFKDIPNSRTQARLLSGVHSYYRFLLYHHYIEQDPSELLEMPKVELHLPDVLSVEEINTMIHLIDLSRPDGHRNRAIIEMLRTARERTGEPAAEQHVPQRRVHEHHGQRQQTAAGAYLTGGGEVVRVLDGGP